MPEQEKDEFGIPIKKKAPAAPVQTDEFGIPVKKKDGGTTSKSSTTPSSPVTEFKSFDPMQPIRDAAAKRAIVPHHQNLNEQGLVGNGQKKSTLIKDVDAQINDNLPADTPQAAKQREEILSDFQKNNVAKIAEVRDGLKFKYQTEALDFEENQRKKAFSAAPGSPVVPLDVKQQLDEQTNAVRNTIREKDNHSQAVMNEYLRNAIVSNHTNPADADRKAAIVGFQFNKDISKEVYQSIGKDLDKYQVPRTSYVSGNKNYDQQRAGAEAVIASQTQEINDLIEQGKLSNSPALLDAAQEKAKEIDHHQKVLNNLDNDYPDVQVQKTARFLGDIMQDLGYSRSATISRQDVLNAAQEAEKQYPGFMAKYGKYVDQVAESEGSGFFGSMKSGLIPRSNLVGQLDQSIKSWVLAKTGDVASLLGDDQIAKETLEAAAAPTLQGPSTSGGYPTKIVFGKEGSYVEKANEDYGKISWNNAVRSFAHAAPGLAEWIGAEKAFGGGLTGLIGASYITGYESNRRLANEIIDDNTGFGDAKKVAFANLSTLLTAGVFHALGASPNKIMEQSLSNSTKSDVLKLLEKTNFKEIDDHALDAMIKENYIPRAINIMKGAGQSLKEGTTMAAAAEAANKLTQLSAAIVNPKKADFGDTEENIKSFIGQALTMSLFPALGKIAGKGGEVPYVAKDALYDAALQNGVITDHIHDMMENGQLDRDKGTMMIKMIKTMRESVDDASLQTTKAGTPLSTRQAKEWAVADFRGKLGTLFKDASIDIGGGEHTAKESAEKKSEILAQNDYDHIEKSQTFQSIEPVAEGGEKPNTFIDIIPNKKYSIVEEGEKRVVMGDTLQDMLIDPATYEKEQKRLKELQAKANPVIEGGKVVKPGEPLTESEQQELDRLIEKQPKPAEEQKKDFTGIRDDDFAKKYLTPEEYDRWHELDKNNDPEAKKIISDKKQELSSNENVKTEIQQPSKAKESPIEKVDKNIQQPEEKTEKSVTSTKSSINADDIIAGKKVFQRFSPQEQRGFAESGKPNVEASLLLAADERSGRPNYAQPETQENRIEEYSKENNNWVDDTTKSFTEKYGQPIASGEEAIVWADPENGRVVKTQDTFQYGNLQQKLDGITLHNAYFPEAAIKVLGFGRNSKGEFQVIVEQPFIQGEKLTPEEIHSYLENIGFKKTEEGNYSNGDVLIEDIHTGNAIKDKDGNIIIIDPIMRLNTPEQGYGGERKLSTDISEPIKTEQDEREKERRQKNVLASTEGTGGESKPPVTEPPKPPRTDDPSKIGSPKQEWTSVRNEKLKEISGAEELFKNQRRKGWTETYNNALNNVQAEYPNKSLFDAMKSKLDSWVMKLDTSKDKLPSTSPDEDTAMLNVLRSQIDKRIGEIEGWDSDIDSQRFMAMAEWQQLQQDLFNVARVSQSIGTGVSRGLEIRQAEINNDSDEGLKIRRMELMQSKGGEKLSDEDLQFTADLWEKEKEIIRQQQEARERSMQEKFDKELEKVRKEYEKDPYKSPKTSKERKENLLKQSGKDLADKIRSGKITGLKSDPLGFSVAFNAALEVIATAVEQGATLAQAIKDYVDKNKIKNEEEFTRKFTDTLDRQFNRADVLQKITDYAKDHNINDVSNDMVGKNLIRDYVNSFIGSVDQKDILNEATNSLKKVLPELDGRKLRDAYLKEGEYKQPTKKQLDDNISNATRSLKQIAKLEEDIEDLNNLKKLKSRGTVSDPERSAYEKQLMYEKESIIKKRSEEREQLRKEYRDMESERNRQLARVSELNKKLEELRNGIRNKQAKSEKVDTPEIENLKEKVKEADKDLRQVEAAVRKAKSDAEKKQERIRQLDEDIQRVKSGQELLRRGKNISDKKVDEDIQAKQDELRRAMRDQGVKVSNEDKYTKASYDQRAQTHNTRIEELVKSIESKLDKGDLTDAQEKSLRTLKDKISVSSVKLDPDSKLSQKNTLEGGLDIIKSIKADFDRSVSAKDMPKMGEFKRDLQKIIDGFQKDKDKSDQDIKLARTKDQLRNEKEELIRKINAEEYEDKPIVELTKSDAELIKLQRDRDAVYGEFFKRQQKYEREHKGWPKRVAEAARAFYVTTLIWKGVTLAKVASSAVLRPQLEAITKLAFGKPFEKLAPAIAYKAKEGGESQSLRSIAKGYEAYFRQFSEKDIQKRFDESTNKFNEYDQKYREAKNKLEAIEDKESSEYKKEKNNVDKLKNQRDKDLINNVSDTMFLYMNPSSLKEFWQVLVNRSADIERNFGNFETENWTKLKEGKNAKQKADIALSNFEYVMNFVGRSHSALKTLSGRQSFAASFMARLEHAVSEGKDVSNADTLLEIAGDSYLDWDRGKYQQSNAISDGWNKIVNLVDQKYPAIAYAMKADVAITRVPVNQIWEALAEYTVGSFTASWDAAKTYYKAKNIALKDGYTPEQAAEFKEQIRKNVSELLTPKQAAIIVRSFRKGGFGLGLYALALLSGVQFGGFPHRGQTADDKRIKKREEETGVPEVKTGQIKIGEHELPEIWAKIAEHTPAVYPALMGTGMAKVYENNIKEGKSTPQSVINTATAQIDNILNAIPQYKVLSPILGDVGQSIKKKAAELDDVDENGELIKRKAYRASDYLDVLFKRKSELLSPDNYKEAVRVSSYYSDLMAQVENDANLSKEQKSEEKKRLEKEKDQEIDRIYERNKEEYKSKQ